MMRKLTYCLLALSLFVFSACIQPKKKINWKVTLDKKDKKPYGAYLAYHSLKYFFPAAKITDLSKGFRYNNLAASQQDQRTLLIALGLDFYVSQNELEKLIDFVQQGNEVILFARVLDHKLEYLLNCTIKDNGYEEFPLNDQNNGAANLNALTIQNNNQAFGYQGRSILASVIHQKAAEETKQTANETQEPYFLEEIKSLQVPADTLGFVKNKPDIIRYKIGRGHLTLHTAPLVMSNYFLLQKDNRKYLQSIWNTLPKNIAQVYWNDYYKRSTKASDLGILMKYAATRWALIIAMFTLLIYLLFNSKRRQRIIAEIHPLENSSVSFAETIGRLYYNKGDHTNLGEKMIQHFLEWVRTHYFINTNELDDRFAQQLILKSGMPETTIRSLMELMREIHIERKPIDEADLYHLHHTIQQFYKNHKS